MAEPDYNDILGLNLEAEEPEPVVEPVPEPAKVEEPEPAHKNSANERIQELIRQRDEERRTREALQAQLERDDTLRSEVATLRAKLEAQATPEPAPVPFLEDPEGHVERRIADLRKELQVQELKAEEGNRAAQAAAEETRQRLVQQQFVQSVDQAEKSFLAQNADYYKALEHVRTIQRTEMEAAGMEPQEIEAAIQRAELQTAITTMSKGKNPAEFAYSRAKIYGYKPEGQPVPAAKIDEEADLAARRAAAGSLGGSGVSDAAGMEDEEARSWAPFERAFKEMFGKDLH
jgi:hypothetical protein